MITKLTLQNFRCFQDFSLDGIRPVTLIAGANNVGKSTLLEGIFLFVDRNSSDVFWKLNSWRGLHHVNLSPKMLWESLFQNMNPETSIRICITNDMEEQTTIFSKDTSFSLSSIPEKTSPFPQGVRISLANSYPLKLVYTDQTRNDISHFLISETGVTRILQKSIVNVTPYIHYFSSRVILSPQEAAEMFGKIEMAGNKSHCVEVLKLLDPRIKDLSVIVIGEVPGIFADLGLSSRLSVNMLGDGINKLMHIALLMLANPGAIILIDEIENGFHYSFFPKLWEIIGKLAVETKCQVFATTHSYECINGAMVLAGDVNHPELFRFVRLDRNHEGRITPHIFDNDSFLYAVENEWEVR